jgi:hypothetical protein
MDSIRALPLMGGPHHQPFYDVERLLCSTR